MNAEANWDAVADTVEFTIQPELDRLRGLVPYEARVLDFGCGYGRIAVQLLESGFTSVDGYDQSARMIARGRELSPTLRLRHLPALPVPEQEGSYAAILCCAVLTTIPDRAERRLLTNEFWRLLSRGGILYAVEFLRTPTRTYAADGAFKSALGPPMKHFEKEELVEESGQFSLIEAWEREDRDLRGNRAKVLHVLWRK